MEKEKDIFELMESEFFHKAFKNYEKELEKKAKHKVPTENFKKAFLLSQKVQEFIRMYDDENASARIEYDELDMELTIILPLFNIGSNMMLKWREMMKYTDEIYFKHDPFEGYYEIKLVVRNIFKV